MEKINKKIRQGSTEPIVWPVSADYTSKNVFLTVKDNYDSSIRLIDKANTLGGGDDDILTVESGSITFNPVKADTSALYGDKYYELTYTDDAGENVPVIIGILTIERVVRLDTDETAAATSVFYDQRYEKMFMVEVDDDGSKLQFKDLGFDLVTADITTAKLGNGVFKITSGEAVLLTDMKIVITPLDRIAAIAYHSSYEVLDTQNLEVRFIDLARSGNRINTKFLCEVYKMRW